MDPVALPSIPSLGRSIASVLARYPDIAAAYLFGSAARGQGSPRDLDIGLVLRARCARSYDYHRLLGDLASRLQGVLPLRPDLVLLEEQGPVFCHDVLLEGVRVYEADEDRRVDFESETYVRALDFRPTQRLALEGQIGGLRRWLATLK